MMKKRGFLVLALVMSVAGVASAFAPVPQDPAARPPARELAMPVAAKQPGPMPVAPAPEPVIKKASFEIRQAPVPLLMKPRPTIEQPVFDAAPVGPQVPAKTTEGTRDSAIEGSRDSAAKAAIAADGYKGVKMVRQGENGIWYAKGMRGTTEVSLTVDATGRVSLE